MQQMHIPGVDLLRVRDLILLTPRADKETNFNMEGGDLVAKLFDFRKQLVALLVLENARVRNTRGARRQEGELARTLAHVFIQFRLALLLLFSK